MASQALHDAVSISSGSATLEGDLHLPERAAGQWDVDVEAGTVTLVEPEISLGKLTIPMVPMLGCFGVGR